jgi:uncharacterized OsmC-like protein
MPDITLKASGKGEGSSQLKVKVRNFDLVVDEPPSAGGQNTGPNPLEYLLVAEIGCLNVIGQGVAKQMGITLTSFEIEASGDLNPARLMGQPSDERAGFTGIDVKIKVEADADEETLQKWLETVESRCPVTDNVAKVTPLTISVEASK